MNATQQAALAATHVFCTVAPAAQAALKADVARQHPRWKVAFSRPGLCTFKLDVPASPTLAAPSFLSRCWGLGLGQVANGEALWAALVKAGLSQLPLRLQVSPRVLPALAESNPPVATEDAAAVRAALLREAPGLALRVLPGEAAAPGDCVVDVLCARGEPHFAGWHVQHVTRVAYPGGALPVAVPTQLVSRAYVKLLEALAWGGVVVRVGDRAVELGSAPGGAVMALLEQGVAVTGVDPGAMDPRVEAYVGPGGARLTHLRRLMSAVGPADLGQPLHWLLLDANVAPQVALSTVARLLAGPRQDALCGVVLTLKLDGFAAAHHVPGWVKRVEALGMAWVGATHLPSNHTEVCVVGLTRAGLARRAGVGK